jgi:tetratricopeptide (TPR) repeat protein
VQRASWGASAIVAVVLAGAIAPARAGAPGASRAASEHVATAVAAYRAGEYERALAELEVGYAIEPRLEFLISFAQVYGALGRYAEAIDRCERYLAAAPGSPLAREVQRLERDLGDERARAEAARAAVSPVERAPPDAATRTLPAIADEPEPAPSTRAPAPRRSRVTWMIAGGGTVVVVALGLGLGLGLGLRDGAPATRLGTVSFP